MKGLEEWGSRRRIDILAPDTFYRKLILISTTCNHNGGQTARADVEALNYFCASEYLGVGTHWRVLKAHKTFKEAIKFHEDYVKKLKFVDSKKC